MRAASQAAPNPTSSSPEGRATQFVPVEGGEETTSATTMLVSAYVIVWVLLMLFVFLGWRRQRGIESRIDDLEKALEQNKGAS